MEENTNNGPASFSPIAKTLSPVHSTTERIVEEGPDGQKVSTFRFVQFRTY